MVDGEQLRVGLYAIEYDFTKIDAASRELFRRVGADYHPLNPTGCFFAGKAAFVLKIEDAASMNHLVVTVDPRDITVRPGVRQH